MVESVGRISFVVATATEEEEERKKRKKKKEEKATVAKAASLKAAEKSSVVQWCNILPPSGLSKLAVNARARTRDDFLFRKSIVREILRTIDFPLADHRFSHFSFITKICFYHKKYLRL